MQPVFDVIGIGFGPANIALAVAMEEFGFEGTCLFLERRANAAWQPEMLLPGSDIQNHPCRDLVTPRNPRSRYTFMNFLFEHKRLFEHLNLGLEFPLRFEYAQYVSWVASFFEKNVRYGACVEHLRLDPADPEVYLIELAGGEVLRARSVVVAPGRTPLVPEVFKPLEGSGRVFHLTQFMSRMRQLEANAPLEHIGVIGGSQSAAELVGYLRDQYPNARISNVMRAYGYRLKDTSQFSEHVYFPEFVDYYYKASPAVKKRINQHLHYTNYSAVDRDVIEHLYARMYEDRLRGEERIHIHASHEIQGCAVGRDGRVDLTLNELNIGEARHVRGLDAVVLATGFRNFGTGLGDERCPALLNELYPRLATHADGVLKIERDYALLGHAAGTLPPLYLNGLCESSHGYGDAGSFSLLALRSAEIYRSLESKLNHPEAEKVAVAA